MDEAKFDELRAIAGKAVDLLLKECDASESVDIDDAMLFCIGWFHGLGVTAHSKSVVGFDGSKPWCAAVEEQIELGIQYAIERLDTLAKLN